jgi:hypothetical protein
MVEANLSQGENMSDDASQNDSTEDTGEDIFADESTEPDVEPEDSTDDADDDALGDKGKRALDNMKSKWKNERTKRQEAEQRLAELEAGDGDDSKQRAADAAVLAKANQRIVKAEVRAAAGGKLADPVDALNFIDLDQFEVGEDGDVDQEEIAEAIEDLIRRKPYLAAQGGTSRPKPDRSQGARGKGSSTPAQQFAAAIDNLL